MKSGQKEKPAVSCGVTGPTGAAGLGDAPNNKEQKNVVRIRFGSSARHDRYLTELPKIREKKGGKRLKQEKAAEESSTAFAGDSSAAVARRAVCRSSDLNVQPRVTAARNAPTLAFSPSRYRISMTRFRGTRPIRRAEPTLRSYSYKSDPRSDPCPGFSPDSLVQREQECVSDPSGTGSRICHKSRS